MADLLIRDGNFNGKCGHQVGPSYIEILRWFIQFRKCRSHMDLNLFGCSFPDLNVMLMPHIGLDISL